MTITVNNGIRVELDVAWAAGGRAGFCDEPGKIQLAYEPVVGAAPPAIGDDITIESTDYIVYDFGRDASTQLRILFLVPVE